jgi:nicotinate-nucleotide adenylyltransferase
MGGTFDPIHHGHLVAASEVGHFYSLDEVIFVPTGHPWQKKGRRVSAGEDRYLMTVIATASNPRFSVSRVDIDRPGPTYTIDTLRDLRRLRGPDAEFFFITGADALEQIMTWQDADELFKLAHFVGCTRPGHQLRGTGLPDGRVSLIELLDHVPGASREGRADLVPRAGRDRSVHLQAPAVPGRRCWPGTRLSGRPGRVLGRCPGGADTLKCAVSRQARMCDGRRQVWS